MPGIAPGAKVYFAGKIAKNDWRGQFLSSLRDSEPDRNPEPLTLDSRFIYAGPWFIACDHGCFHGPNTHGRGASKSTGCLGDGEGMDSARQTFSKCRNWIYGADVVFAWIDKADAFGTLVEIGMAREMGKPVFLAFSKGFENAVDMWFASQASSQVVRAENPLDAWKEFTKGVTGRSGITAGLASPKQRSYVMSLLKARGKQLRIDPMDLSSNDAGVIISSLKPGGKGSLPGTVQELIIGLDEPTDSDLLEDIPDLLRNAGMVLKVDKSEVPVQLLRELARFISADKPLSAEAQAIVEWDA